MQRRPPPGGGRGPVTIRAARVADASALGEFLVPVWLQAHAGQVPDVVLRRRRRDWTSEVSSAAWRRTLSDIDATPGHPSTVLVAETSARHIVGIGMVTVVGDGSAEVDALYVAPELHGSGIGRSVLSELAAVAAADGVSSIGVQVLSANEPGCRFYEHLGAERAGESIVDDDGVELAAVRYRWTVDQLVGATR